MNLPDNPSDKSSSQQNPETNTGESMVQGGGADDIVNEQKQNNSVNQEEFVDDMAANTHFYDSQKAGLARNDDDTADAQKQLPTEPEEVDNTPDKEQIN